MTDDFSDLPAVHNDTMHTEMMEHFVRQLQRSADQLVESLSLPMSVNLWEEVMATLTPIQPDWVQVRRGGAHVYGHQAHFPSGFIPDTHKTYAISRPVSKRPMNRDQWVLCSLCGQPVKTVISDTTVDLLVLCPTRGDGTGWVARTLPLPTRPAGVFQ